jgi:hypothetical protein
MASAAPMLELQENPSARLVNGTCDTSICSGKWIPGSFENADPPAIAIVASAMMRPADARCA